MYDCIIVGGGLIGLLTARQLASAGLSVLVLDRAGLGGESSWAGGGILSPLYPWRYPRSVSLLARVSQQHYPALARVLAEESGVDPEWIPSGLLVLDTDEQQQAVEWSRQFSARLDCLAGRQGILALEPGLGKAADAALWMPGIAQIRNPRLMKAMTGSLGQHCIDVAENEPVEAIEYDNGRVIGVKTARRRIPTDRVVVTAGAWSTELLKATGIELDVQPVRGQMLVFKARPGVVKHIVLSEGYYLIPRQDGRVLIGSTLEYVGFDKSTTDEARHLLYSKAIELVPGLSDFEVERHWSGLRPGTIKGIPYIGRHPGIENLYFNAGHFRNGVVLGLASARLMADIMVGNAPEIDPSPYALDAEH